MERSPTVARVGAQARYVTPPALIPANDNEPPEPPPALALRALAPRFLIALPAGLGASRARRAV